MHFHTHLSTQNLSQTGLGTLPHANLNLAQQQDAYPILYPGPPLSCVQFASPNNMPVVSPPEAGLPFGKGAYTWLALEIHYSNPELKQGQKDPGSGVTLEYTSQLRPNDLGLLTLHQFDLYVPPGKATYSADAVVCPSTCTKRYVEQCLEIQ